MLTEVPEIPSPSAEHNSDYALLCVEGNSDSPHILVYEIARDFLSAPRSFAIIELVTIGPGAIELDSDNQYDAVEYDESGAMVETGMFVVASAEGECDAAGQHIVVSLASQRIELLAHSFECKKVIVATSARSALANYLMD